MIHIYFSRELPLDQLQVRLDALLPIFINHIPAQ